MFVLHRSDEDRRIWNAFRFHSRTFSMAARLLPAPMRLPVATLYVFCRSVDQVADDRPGVVGRTAALAELDALRRRLDHTLLGRPPAVGFLWRRLAEVHRDWSLDPGPLYELIAGASWDLEGRPIEHMDDLVRYADLVGGSIGAMMLPFLADAAAAAPPLAGPARALGRAMQITNIVRDVGEDYARLGRVYLPRTLLARHRLALPDLAGHGPDEAYADLVEELMACAETLYDEGFAAIPHLRPGVRAAITSAARMYREILNEVRARAYDNLAQRAVVPLGRRLRLMLADDYAPRRRALVHARRGRAAAVVGAL